MSLRVTITPADMRRFVGKLDKLPRRVALRQLRIALNAWGGEVKREAVARVPTETRLLKRSLGVRVVIPSASRNASHHGKPARVMVGARRRFVAPAIASKGGKVRTIGIRRATKLVLSGQKVKTRRPSRYAHLAEQSREYIKPAQQVGNTRGLLKFKQKLGQGIETEARRLAATN